MAALWGEQVGRFERTAPGFQGAVLLREGANLLVASSRLDSLLVKPLSCRLRTL